MDGGRRGDRLVPEHEEDEGSEELYVVLRGRARFEIDGETVDAPQGTLVFVQPETNRTAFAEEPGTTVLAIGSTVGQPYEPSGWELWAEFHPAFEAGDHEGVIERARVSRARRLAKGASRPCAPTFGSAEPLREVGRPRAATGGRAVAQRVAYRFTHLGWIWIAVLYMLGMGLFHWLGGIGAAADAIKRWGHASGVRRRRTSSSSA